MICGKVSPAQRDIIRRRCTINVDDCKALLNWCIDNHSSYSELMYPEDCHQPILIGGYDNNLNNTDESHGGDTQKRNHVEEEHMTFAASSELTGNACDYKNRLHLLFCTSKILSQLQC